MKARTSTVLIFGTLILMAADAYAHIQLMYPSQRYDDQKNAPCGMTNGGRGDVVTTLEPGATITVTWDETVNHPGHFRISFDPDGDDDFVDPLSFTDTYTNDSVMVDDIIDTPAGGVSGYTITLPDIECDNCTLQVVQVMTDKAPYGDGNDLYYQCADLVLQAGAPAPADAGTPAAGDDAGIGPGPSGGPVSGGCSTTVPDVAGFWVILIAALLLCRRYNREYVK
jgi:hypothetical protein